MAMKELTEREFAQFGFQGGPMTLLISEEREWYVSESENVLGIVIRDKVDKDWVYVVLGRDTDNQFKWIDGEVSIATEAAAREALIEAMEKYEASGQRVFSQDAPDWRN